MLLHVIFLLYYLLGLLSGPCTAFLEVGVSSYLGSSVHHFPAQREWTLVWPWNVNSGKGFFEAAASEEKEFNESFVTPEPGIYFVALNLHIINTNDCCLKASLAINDEFEENNGIKGVCGNTTSKRTLSFSGLLRLYENDVLTLYLHGSKGTLLANSTFSVVLISRIGSVPGFHAILSADLPIQMISRLENFRTDGTKGLFVMHSGTSPSVGLFCSILEGIYFFSSNLNVKSENQLTGCHLAIVLNSNTTLVQRYSPGEVEYSVSVSGMFYLYRGDCIELLMKPAIGGSLTVQLGSSFSGIFLGMKTDFSSQFSSSVSTGKQAGMAIGWNKVENWSVSNLRRNFQSQYMVLEGNSSTFISETDGNFLVSALVNINSSSNSMEKNLATLLVDVGDTTVGFTGYGGLSAWKTTSLSVSGVISLKKGDTLTVRINSEFYSWEIIDGLLGVYLIPNNWPGVAATLTQTVPLGSYGWTKLTSWKTSNVSGLFSFDNSFFPNHGVYRTHVDGTYFLSCNVIFEGSPRGSLSVIIAIDDVIDTGNGLFSLNENPKRYSTLNVVGSISLTTNQTISVYVAATGLSSWNVSSRTGFSLVLVGANLPSTPGFFAVKEEEASPSSSCGEIDKWRTVAPTFGSFSKKRSQFNSTSGRFKAREDGIYLISANVLIQLSNLSQINLNVLLDGHKDNAALSTFQPRHSSSPGSFFVSTLTLAGTIRLISGQYVSLSIDVHCSSSSSWKVLSNSSFSVVLVSLWDDDYAAGLLAKTSFNSNGKPKYTKVDEWSAVFPKNLEVSAYESVYIKRSGLYFIQSVLILDDVQGNGIFHSGICASGNQILFNGFAGSKVSEGAEGRFVISAFGVLFLQKGQEIDLCTRSEKGESYRHLKDSFFSMATFLKPVQLPGLHQTVQYVYNVSSPYERSFATSFSTAGNQLAYINSMFNPKPKSPGEKGNFRTTLTGTYIFSLSFTLTGNVSANITACVGPQKCAKCYIEVVGTFNYQSNTFGFVGLLDLEKNELLSICLCSQETSFSLVSATRSVQFLNELGLIETVQLKHPSISFGSAGWHRLVGWRNSSGEVIQSIYVKSGGLYFLSLNLLLKVPSKGLVGVRLQAEEAAHQEILSVLSSAEADSSFLFNVAVLSRLNASQAMSISVYSDSQSLNIGNNSTFFAALITNSNNHPCLSLKSKTSQYLAGQWWQAIEQWEDADAQCLSPDSEFTKGRFVTHITGVYFGTALVMIRASGSLNQTRMVELLLSINGETSNTNDLKVTKAATPGSTVALSVSATVYLELWQTLYLMIRSTGDDGTLEVLNGSTFSVALIEETKYYKSVARNFSQFDNGPRIIRHPPPSASLGEDLGENISWTCEAVAKGAVAYHWLRNDQTITSSNNLLLTNVQDSDSGRYVCVAEYDGVKLFSQAANLDVFDTSPQFENQVLTAPENSNVSIELNVSALNKRRRPADVFIMIVKGNTNHTFVLSETSRLNISLRNQLPFDYETTKLYQLTLVATNQDTNKTTSANVTVIITDINDNPPIFTSRNTVSVNEATPPGTVIFQVRATDADYGNNSIITYSFSSEYAQTFSIDDLSGNITVIGNLDREDKSKITLRINATDGTFTVTSELFVIVTDVNDNKPRFTSGNNVSVEENTPLGNVIFQVRATDADYGNNSIITYSLLPGDYPPKFSINASSGNITVIGNLDRENTSKITLRINASDGTFTVTSELFVIITDVNDNKPIFTSRNNVSVEENTPPETVIFQLRATDADYGNNSILTYSLLPSKYAAKFSVDASSGNVTVTGILDRENTSEIILRINATDGTFTVTSELYVIIVDVNDNGPIFTSGRNNTSVEENTSIGTVIFQVKATDADSGINALLNYTLLPGEYEEIFSVDSSSGNISIIRDLDRERISNITLHVQVTDGKFNKSTDLFITVLDVNEFPPVFSEPNYEASIPENAQVNDTVVVVSATDSDAVKNIVIYNITSGNSNETFIINPENGSIFLHKPLDFEREKRYNLTVKGIDDGIPALESLTNVIVTVEDVNDSPPVFTKCEAPVILQEPPLPQTHLFRVSASDADSGSNANITYSIVKNEKEVCSDLFIDQDGNVYCNENSLPQATICNVTIRASDGARTVECVVDLRVAAIVLGDTKNRTGFPKEAKYSLIAVFVFLLIVGAIVIILRFFIIKRRHRRYKVEKDRGNLSYGHLTSPIQPASGKEEKFGRKTTETEI